MYALNPSSGYINQRRISEWLQLQVSSERSDARRRRTETRWEKECLEKRRRRRPRVAGRVRPLISKVHKYFDNKMGISNRECDFRNQRGRFPPLKKLELKELREKSGAGRKNDGFVL